MRDCAQILCCDDPTYRGVTDLLYTIKSEVSMLGNNVMENLWYGRKEGDTGRIRMLRVYHGAMERIRYALKHGGELCLNCDQVQTLTEGIRKVIRRNCDGNTSIGLDKDSSKIAEWSAKNPFCIAYEDWERAMYAICGKIQFDLRIVDVKKACSISYNLIKKNISCDIFVDIVKKAKNCKIKYNILATEKDCDIRYAGILTKKECKTKYTALLKERDCALKFHDYVNVINCGVGTDLVRSIYDCGLSVKFCRESTCPVLVTGEGEEFEFNSFTVENEDQLWSRLSAINIV